jgi:hypothetical protein
MLDRYNIICESDLADGVRKLSAFKSAELSEGERVVAMARSKPSRTSTERARSADSARDA